jgi:adenylate cyclase
MAIAQWDMHRRSACDDDGQEAANRAIALDPRLADAHAALGAAHQGQGRYEVGLQACEAALRFDPDSYEGNRIAGMCCMALRRYDEAIGYFEKAASVVETEFVAASFAPQCYQGKGDRDGAHEASRRALARVERVIAAEPDHGRALGYGAGLLADLGEAERAKEWIERGTLLDPDNTILSFNFVCALSRLGEIDAALDLLDSVIGKASKGWLVWLDNDTDLDPLRSHPRFVATVGRAKARFAD